MNCIQIISIQLSSEEEETIRSVIVEKYEREGHPYYSSARLIPTGMTSSSYTSDWYIGFIREKSNIIINISMTFILNIIIYINLFKCALDDY